MVRQTYVCYCPHVRRFYRGEIPIDREEDRVQHIWVGSQNFRPVGHGGGNVDGQRVVGLGVDLAEGRVEDQVVRGVHRSEAGLLDHRSVEEALLVRRISLVSPHAVDLLAHRTVAVRRKEVLVAHQIARVVL